VPYSEARLAAGSCGLEAPKAAHPEAQHGFQRGCTALRFLGSQIEGTLGAACSVGGYMTWRPFLLQLDVAPFCPARGPSHTQAPCLKSFHPLQGRKLPRPTGAPPRTGPRCCGPWRRPSNRNNHAGPGESPLTTCQKINCLIGLPCRRCARREGRKSFLTATLPLPGQV
jgi:hypothetical protein